MVCVNWILRLRRVFIPLLLPIKSREKKNIAHGQKGRFEKGDNKALACNIITLGKTPEICGLSYRVEGGDDYRDSA